MSESFDILNFSSYRITTIDAICNTSCPCIHEVSITFLNKSIKINMGGDLIAKYYKYYNMDIPYHYNTYISDRSMLN